MRITQSRLLKRFDALAEARGWDNKGNVWTARPGGGNCARLGATFLEHNSVYGYSINRIVNESWGESCLKEPCSAKDMDAWLDGALFIAWERDRT